MHQITRETMKTRRASLPILQHRVGFSRENTCSSLSLSLSLSPYRRISISRGTAEQRNRFRLLDCTVAGTGRCCCETAKNFKDAAGVSRISFRFVELFLFSFGKIWESVVYFTLFADIVKQLRRVLDPIHTLYN